MKFCINCRFYNAEIGGATSCSAPKAIEHTVNLVTGEVKHKFTACWRQRFMNKGAFWAPKRCGPGGIWFEPKQAETR